MEQHGRRWVQVDGSGKRRVLSEPIPLPRGLWNRHCPLPTLQLLALRTGTGFTTCQEMYGNGQRTRGADLVPMDANEAASGSLRSACDLLHVTRSPAMSTTQSGGAHSSATRIRAFDTGLPLGTTTLPTRRPTTLGCAACTTAHRLAESSRASRQPRSRLRLRGTSM
jgi:hypothetical protein